jgi:CDP-diacylglycerol--glycerol-3-phosphate 3-phosphatidyltransferase
MTPQTFHRGEGPAPRPTDWNLPNALTVLRFLLVPVYGVLLFKEGGSSPWWRFWAWVVFVFAAVTDGIDGKIARERGEITNFGKVADPIADKALTGAALVLLSAYGVLWWWVTLLILIREWGVTLLRFWVIRLGVIPASRGGKVKTVLQIAAISWYLWPFPEPLSDVGPWLMAAALIVTVITGIDYVVTALRMRAAKAD